jgi:acyl-coenzyme A thioesterase PaaI-like protein
VASGGPGLGESFAHQSHDVSLARGQRCPAAGRSFAFAAAAEFTLDLPDLTAAHPDDVADALLPSFFAVWENDTTFVALLRAAMTSPTAADTMRRIFATQVAPKLAAITPDHPAQRAGLVGAFVIRFTTDGDQMPWGNVVIGVRNPVAPPLVVQQSESGVFTDFHLGAAYEGPPGHVHGGVAALVLDHILGAAASSQTKPRLTGTITLRYLRTTRLGNLRAEARIARTEGVKTYAVGHLADEEGITVEAEGVFIQPRWARD